MAAQQLNCTVQVLQDKAAYFIPGASFRSLHQGVHLIRKRGRYNREITQLLDSVKVLISTEEIGFTDIVFDIILISREFTAFIPVRHHIQKVVELIDVSESPGSAAARHSPLPGDPTCGVAGRDRKSTR